MGVYMKATLGGWIIVGRVRRGAPGAPTMPRGGGAMRSQLRGSWAQVAKR